MMGDEPLLPAASASSLRRRGRDAAEQNDESNQRLLFVDQQSLTQGLRQLAEVLFEQESARVLNQLPVDYRDKFGTVGYCRRKPVQIVGPYHVPMGPLRAAWMEEFRKNKAKGTLIELPYLVYWYLEPHSDDLTKSVSLELSRYLLPYDEGKNLEKHLLPKNIQKKYFCQERLTEDEERTVLSLRRFHTAGQTQDRTLPFTVEPISNQFTIEWHDAAASDSS